METNIDENIKILKKEIELKEKKYNQIKYETEFIRSDNTFDKMLKEYLKKNKKKNSKQNNNKKEK